VCDLRLAVNDQRDQPPLFIDVATFGPGADACAEYLTRGRAVGETGRLVYQEWEKDGVKRSKHQVVGRVSFGGRPDDDQVTAGERESDV
jgi:single-stranded DNA-binding protein